MECKGHLHLKETIETDNIPLKAMCEKMITVPSSRTRELGIGLVKQELAAKNLLKHAGNSWQTSKFGYAISGTKTAIYRMKACISNTIECIDRIGKLLASLNSYSASHGN